MIAQDRHDLNYNIFGTGNLPGLERAAKFRFYLTANRFHIGGAA